MNKLTNFTVAKFEDVAYSTHRLDGEMISASKTPADKKK